MPGFLQLWPIAHFPFAGWALHPFAVINPCHESNCALSPPRELLNLGHYLEAQEKAQEKHTSNIHHGMSLFQCEEQILLEYFHQHFKTFSHFMFYYSIVLCTNF